MLSAVQFALISIPSFIIVLSVVVFVHEWGHFQAAKLRKVAIDTFSIGFGKTLIGWRDKHGVQWKIGALPLGGYVKFADDTDAISSTPKEEYSDPVAKAEARRKGLFHAQSLLTRTIVVSAGPITNFLFAILAFAALLQIVGRDVTDVSKIPARIASVNDHTAASAAGLHAGDIIRSVDGRRIANFDDMRGIIAASAGKPLALQVERNSQLIAITATPTRAATNNANIVAGSGMLGVSGPLVFDSERVVERVNPLQALQYGLERTWETVAQTGRYVGGVIVGKESGNQIAGPIGIFTVSGRAASESINGPPDISLGKRLLTLSMTLLSLAALISVAVGIVNLLPIPILDGGHLLFYAIEGLRGGKPLPPAAQEWAYRAGFAVMASLFLFATWNDIARLMPGSPG